MTQLIAVKGWYQGDILGELKRAALLADRIAIRHIHAEGECDKFPHVKAEIAHLIEIGVAIRPDDVKYDLERHPWLKDYDRRIVEDPTSLRRAFYMAKLGEPDLFGKGDAFERELYTTAADAFARAASAVLTDDTHIAVPLLVSNRMDSHVTLPTKKAEVAKLTYDRLPMPSDDTPWEAIFDWRSDDEGKQKFARLRVWVNRMARAGIPVSEIEDELESAIHDYRAYMKVQHAKIPLGRFEAICMATAEVLQELPKIKLSPLIDAIFRFDKVTGELTEKELTAPQREIAYIVRAQKDFGDRA